MTSHSLNVPWSTHLAVRYFQEFGSLMIGQIVAQIWPNEITKATCQTGPVGIWKKDEPVTKLK